MMIAARNAFLMSGGSSMPTARDYVQDGLIAMWDGIENAGWGVHDPNATEWKNLNESGPTLARKSSPIAWLDNALTITSANGNYGAFSVSSSSFASSVKTVEVVASFSATNNVQSIFNIGTGVSAGVGISTTGFMSAAGKTPFTSAGNDKPQSGSWLFSGGMNSAPVECYRNGISSSTGSTAYMSVGGKYLTNTFVIGSLYNASYHFVGKIHSIRLYSRALTAAEVAANDAVDAARFGL